MKTFATQFDANVEKAFDAAEDFLKDMDAFSRKMLPFRPLTEKSEQFVLDASMLGLDYSRKFYDIQKSFATKIAAI